MEDYKLRDLRASHTLGWSWNWKSKDKDEVNKRSCHAKVFFSELKRGSDGERD